MEDYDPIKRLLEGNAVPYYSGKIREGMRRTGVTSDLVTPDNKNISESVAAYVSILAATFATMTEEKQYKIETGIADVVNKRHGMVAKAVGHIYRGDYILYHAGFYLLNPSDSDLCKLAKASYAKASEALSEVTVFPVIFFDVVKNNIEGLMDSLAAVSNEVIKPSINGRAFSALFEIGANPLWN